MRMMQDKNAFAAILRKISKIQKSNGSKSNYVVLREKWLDPSMYICFSVNWYSPLPPTPTTPNNLLNVFVILLHMVEDKQKLLQIFWGKFLRYTGQMDLTVDLSERWLSPFAFRCFPPANFPKSNNVISNKTLSSYPNSPLLSQKKKKKKKRKEKKNPSHARSLFCIRSIFESKVVSSSGG